MNMKYDFFGSDKYDSPKAESLVRNGKLYEEFRDLVKTLPEEYEHKFQDVYISIIEPIPGIRIKKTILYERHEDPDEDFRSPNGFTKYGRRDMFHKALNVETFSSEDGVKYLKENFKKIIQDFLEETKSEAWKTILEFTTETGMKMIEKKTKKVICTDCDELEKFAAEQIKVDKVYLSGLKMNYIQTFPKGYYD